MNPPTSMTRFIGHAARGERALCRLRGWRSWDGSAVKCPGGWGSLPCALSGRCAKPCRTCAAITSGGRHGREWGVRRRCARPAARQAAIAQAQGVFSLGVRYRRGAVARGYSRPHRGAGSG